MTILDGSTEAEPSFSGKPPFTPCWLDDVQRMVDRIGLPLWIFYPLVWVILIVIAFVLQWRGQDQPILIGQFEIVLTLSIVYALGVVHINNRMAGIAFDSFRPSLKDMNNEQQGEWRYRLTHMPARITWFVTLIGIIFAVLNYLATPESLRAQWYNFDLFPLLTIYKLFFGVLLGVSGALFLLNIYRQSQIVGTLLSEHTEINVFDQQRLYTLSGVSGRFALELVGLFILYLLWYATDPTLSANSLTTVIGAGYVAAMSFLLIQPMFRVHRLLQSEKSHLIAQCNLHLEKIIARLHASIDTDDLNGLETVNKGLSNLELELKVLQRIPTWPWPPETLRWLVAALLFPLLIWLAQWILERILLP